MKPFAKAIAAAVALACCTMAVAMPGYSPQRWQMRQKWSTIGNLPRHKLVRDSGVPAPYVTMANPLPKSPATLRRGAIVYARQCQSCHGASGQGDGPEGLKLVPRPGDLAWLSEMQVSRSDGFLYWTIAEGGAPISSAMPPFKNALTSDDIWSVSAYIQAHLPDRR
jgi:mono/diheme cytochrome c family protein